MQVETEPENSASLASQSTDLADGIDAFDEGASVAAIEATLTSDVKRGSIDLVLLSVVTVLVGIGLLVVYTGSAVDAAKRWGDDMIFVNQQLWGVALGFVALTVVSRIDYRTYRKHTRLIYLLTFILLLAIWIPGVGVEVNGARRWLNLIFMRFQPAELAKLTICIFMAYSMEKRAAEMSGWAGFYKHGVPVGVLLLPIFLQPDFGSTVIISAIAALMLWMGGVKLTHFMATGALILPLGGFALLTEPYRVARLKTWLNPWDDAASSSFQLLQGWVALANGGLTGTGFGQGNAIFGYIPEMYNDWAAALIGEEFGFVGFTVFALLYAVLGWRGYRIAARAKDSFGALLAFALTSLILGQAVFNLGVIVGILPTKGLTLPFVSFGRSSLIMMLIAVGILLNISQNNPDLRAENSHLRTLRDKLLGRKDGDKRWRDRRIKELEQGTKIDD